MPTEEPESIKKWREAHKKALEEKDENEKTKIAELKEQGKQELEEWYTRYADQLQKSKQQNRYVNLIQFIFHFPHFWTTTNQRNLCFPFHYLSI